MRRDLTPRAVFDTAGGGILVRDRHPSASAIDGAHLVQELEVSSQLHGRSPLGVFSQLLAGKRVLHVGYADWPITDPAQHLHVQLDGVCAALDGIEANDDAASVIGGLVKGRLFTRWEQVTDAYDVVLAPDVLAHVADVETLFARLDEVDFQTIILTVPDASQTFARRFDYDLATQVFAEIVHPNQHSWYSPYTFYNVVTKHTDWHVIGMWFFAHESLLMIATKGC